MRLGVLVATGVAAGLLVSVASGRGSDARFTALSTPVADSYVSVVTPTLNFGSADSLKVAGRSSSAAYLRFRVSVPAGTTVQRATLQLFASAKSTTGFTVHPVTSTNWHERTIDYANVPRIRSTAVAASGPYRANAYVSVDVTPLVSRTGVVSLALQSPSAAPLAFKSREAPTGRPRLVVTVGTAAVTAARPGSGDSGAPCGTLSGAPHGVDHVIWIWMENKSYGDVIGSSSAPFENQLAAQCGVATNYHGITHPSLPNYIAATSGGTQGVTDDESPSAHPLDVASIYSQLNGDGKGWRDYIEGAPGPCPLTSSGTYAVKHDPAAYYTGIRNQCGTSDIPMGTTSSGAFLDDLTSGTLPAFSFIAPDLNDDTHDASVGTGDAWLQSWLPKIAASRDYRAGKTVVFVTWDEDDGSSSNRVPFIVMSPWTKAGTQPSTVFDHYSLLKTTEQLLGLSTFLGHAGDAGTASMVSSFNLG